MLAALMELRLQGVATFAQPTAAPLQRGRHVSFRSRAPRRSGALSPQQRVAPSVERAPKSLIRWAAAAQL
jgi:hypothetical protein